ncbi:hemolysin family protein [Asticcacaulis sp. EMRT-3]|uniref:hemolysin family protein n=1 Tax=Asticcacaulis sp. EMRT-3 TaxID=3040349 RepID=UPI0024AFF56F|nr:hemolysin family protein [Asticcacaulis sp. EMRT-3]MDI7775679.1 hemolysin family protein [Asticcacaulis sp. EMRT-3]
MPDPDGPQKRSFLSFFGFGKKPQTKEELQSAEAAGSDGDLIRHARAFQTMTVADVMTPRVDIIGVDLSATLADVVRIFVESEHSRLPIYRDTLDDPVGVIHMKDVLKLMSPETGRAAPNWAEPVLHRLRREALYVPSSMTTADLLLRMQARRIHMALVIDEFGGTDGLVTLEDLLEAVVGDIEDEYDEVEPEGYRELPGGQIEADGRMELTELEERLGLSLYPEDTEEEIDTLAGLVAVLAGRVPQRGEVIPYPAAGLDIEVVDADARRIKRLRLHRRGPVSQTALPDLTAADD